MYIFPGKLTALCLLSSALSDFLLSGLGLGCLIAQVTSVTDAMVEASSLALSESLTAAERADGLIYPRIERIRQISAQIAARVIRTAQKAVSTLSIPVLFPQRAQRPTALVRRPFATTALHERFAAARVH